MPTRAQGEFLEPTKKPSSGQFLTKNEVARILRLSTKTIDRYLKQGHLNYFKIGRYIRISAMDFERFVRQHTFPNKSFANAAHNTNKEANAPKPQKTPEAAPQKTALLLKPQG